MKKLSFIAFCTIFASSAFAREQIRIVGSSTVFPFTSVAAENFGRAGEFSTPIVESTGTGGGFKLFCSGVGFEHPDFTNASRAILDSERELCKKNGVEEITEIKLGFDGIVVAHAISADDFDISIEHLFLALAKQVPQDGKLVDNFYQKWNEIDAKYPKLEIEVYGPPPTSGTRDAFVELVMEKGCESFPEYAAAFPDEKERKKNCAMMREDKKYIESGENDNLIVQKLRGNAAALGIFGYSYLEQNASLVKAIGINGVLPEFEKIVDGSYPIARSMFVYGKNAHFDKVKGMKEFIKELVSDAAMDEYDGYMVAKGLIPLTKEELDKIRSELIK